MVSLETAPADCVVGDKSCSDNVLRVTRMRRQAAKLNWKCHSFWILWQNKREDQKNLWWGQMIKNTQIQATCRTFSRPILRRQLKTPKILPSRCTVKNNVYPGTLRRSPLQSARTGLTPGAFPGNPPAACCLLLIWATHPHYSEVACALYTHLFMVLDGQLVLSCHLCVGPPT